MPFPDYDTIDGQSFLMLRSLSGGSAPTEQMATMVFNWFEELRALDPSSR